ncbi:MAG TPA: hypothetical protein VG317_08185 [Pseudonocardiaceae bacterium]|nr:hypothetical protein [Pseudonocardiaceae bacterium]
MKDYVGVLATGSIGIPDKLDATIDAIRLDEFEHGSNAEIAQTYAPPLCPGARGKHSTALVPFAGGRDEGGDQGPLAGGRG